MDRYDNERILVFGTLSETDHRYDIPKALSIGTPLSSGSQVWNSDTRLHSIPDTGPNMPQNAIPGQHHTALDNYQREVATSEMTADVMFRNDTLIGRCVIGCLSPMERG